MNETVAIANYIGLSAVIFFIGVAGVLTRRNPLIILMAIELMWNAANLALVAFAKSWLNNAGHIFVFLVVTVAAAEAAIGLAIVVIVFRERPQRRRRRGSVAARMMLYALWLLPLVGALVLWTFGPQLKGLGGWVATAFVAASFALTVALFGAASQPNPGSFDGVSAPLVTWIPGFAFGLMLDPLSLLWTLVITGIGGLIHLYAIGYMEGDRAVARFFAYMNFFVFAMLTLVLSDNFVGLLVGWGLVGLASYFLIGFWFFKPSAVAAARKAFVINVVGDVGLMFAVFVLFKATGSAGYWTVFEKAPTLPESIVLLACICTLHRLRRQVGAGAAAHLASRRDGRPDPRFGADPRRDDGDCGRLPRRTLRAAVERTRPTRRSWSARSARSPRSPARSSASRSGTSSACWPTRRCANRLHDHGRRRGRVLGRRRCTSSRTRSSRPTVLGSRAGDPRAGDEQDIRNMGGLRTEMPFAFWTMLIGTMSICGFPRLLAGFYSKDEVVYQTLERGHPWMYAVAALTAGITAFYMFRMFFIAFFGKNRAGAGAAHAHHGPLPASG